MEGNTFMHSTFSYRHNLVHNVSTIADMCAKKRNIIYLAVREA